MVKRRTISLIFTWGNSIKDADGYPTEATDGTVTLLCRLEPNGHTRKHQAPNGEFIEVKYVVFTDPFSSTLPQGAKCTYLGHPVEVLLVHPYQKNTEIWLG